MTTSRSSAKALVALTMSFVVVVVLALAVDCSARTRSALDGCTGAYGWPVRPFDHAHPIRGGFGDPRTRFDAPRTEQALLESDGSFSFHQGVDINAPDGSPVYAVSSGTVTRARGQRVTVMCSNGRAFQYWHIYEKARVGQRVEPGKTLIGFILPKREHVHLTELVKGRAVNPVAPGHLTPYRDTTSPEVLDITIRANERGGEQLPGDVHGRVFFVAEAVDMPALAVRGRWEGSYPVTPARLIWRIEGNGRVVIRERVARDVRRSLPKNDRFWQTFARGTCQNWPVFDSRHYRFETGRQLFTLSAGRFDTRRLRDGVYELVVTASDTAGNRAERRLRITVQNLSVS
jgi:hypothetical protein